MSWKKSMAPSGKSRLAGRLGLAGVSASWRWQTRERPASEGAHYMQLKDAQPDRHAWALASPQPRTCMGLKLTRAVLAWRTQRLPVVCSCTDGRRGGPGARGLRGARQPLPSGARASARDPAAAVTVAAPRLPPAPGCCRHPPAPLRVALTGRGSGERPGPGCRPRAEDPLRDGRWEGLAGPAFRFRQGWATRHLRPLGSRESAEPRPVTASMASWEGEQSQWRLLPNPDSQRHRRARPPA